MYEYMTDIDIFDYGHVNMIFDGLINGSFNWQACLKVSFFPKVNLFIKIERRKGN